MSSSTPPRLPPIHSLDLPPLHQTTHITHPYPSDPLLPPGSHMNDTIPVNHARAQAAPSLPPPRLSNADPLDQSEDHDEDDYSDGDGDQYEELGTWPWQPLAEDTSSPCDDEMAYIESKGEHSAQDHVHWEQETFFDLRDPDIKPGAIGRIEWTVTNFNGTKDKPNRTLVMKSDVVNIGGYDWQIKFYPQGNRTEFLSAYLENVTMAKNDFVDTVDMKHPPLPVLVGSPRAKRRVSVAAQVSIIMYNPAEPRVFEVQTDAHQFHKQSADFGWKYFTREPRSQFFKRRHGQRQAILRKDTLAFTAYIRIVDDPTGCMWETGAQNDYQKPPTTLVRFETMSARVASLVLLFHLPPFRKWLYTTKSTSPRILALQVALDRFLGRRLKRKHIKHQGFPSGCDVVSVIHALVASVKKEDTTATYYDMCSMLNCFAADDTPVAQHRLKSKKHSTIQQAISDMHTQGRAHPIMTFELERQEFNKEKRAWKKLSEPCMLEDKITYADAEYQLYSFVTHAGRLGSRNYATYIRPNGIQGLWYVYSNKSVTCITNRAAKLQAQGLPLSQSKTAEQAPKSCRDGPIAYLAVYIRSDWTTSVFAAPAEESWIITDKLAELLGRLQHRRDAKPETARAPLPDVKMALAHAAPLTQASGLFSPAHASAHDLDDDVIMSDVEDNVPVASHLHKFLWEGVATETKCVDYFAGEYYHGTVNNSGQYQGTGHLIRGNGDEYQGQFDKGQPSGQGTMIYGISGDKYEGTWLQGQHHGQGRLIEKESGNVFDGGWQEGRKHGAFVLKGTITEDDKEYCQICYERKINIAFMDCGHVLACKVCAAAVQQCPLCRKQVLGRVELFGVKISVQ